LALERGAGTLGMLRGQRILGKAEAEIYGWATAPRKLEIDGVKFNLSGWESVTLTAGHEFGHILGIEHPLNDRFGIYWLR